ncbi:hypothetical protein U9M48_036464, partial [Paspalum notatum var. saurae]
MLCSRLRRAPAACDLRLMSSRSKDFFPQFISHYEC